MGLRVLTCKGTADHQSWVHELAGSWGQAEEVYGTQLDGECIYPPEGSKRVCCVCVCVSICIYIFTSSDCAVSVVFFLYVCFHRKNAKAILQNLLNNNAAFDLIDGREWYECILNHSEKVAYFHSVLSLI